MHYVHSNFRHNSPYYSPLTPLARPVVLVILYVFVLLHIGSYVMCWFLLALMSCVGFYLLFVLPLWWIGPNMWTSERLDYSSFEYNKNDSREGCSEVIIGDRHLRPTFGRLDEDHELERLFSGFPGFHNSKVLKELLRGLSDKQKLRLLETVIRLLDRTFSSNL